MNFIQALTRQLQSWQDETTWLRPDHIQEMLVQAAAESLKGQELSRITLRREVEPEELEVRFVLEVEGEYLTSLDPQDIRTLRALLLSLDETIPARVGDSLSMPTTLRSGRTVSEVTQELLDEERGEGE